MRVSRFPEVTWKALGRWRKNNKWDCWGIDLGIFAYFRFCRQQMYTDLVTLNFWNGCAQWTPWQSALPCISRAEGRLEFALGWYYHMSHSCPACDVLSKFQVAKSQSSRLATGICIHLNSCSIFLLGTLSAAVTWPHVHRRLVSISKSLSAKTSRAQLAERAARKRSQCKTDIEHCCCLSLSMWYSG